MTTSATTVQVELTQAELTMLVDALRSFESAFGHDEADVLHAIKALLAKLTASTPA